MFNSFDNSLGWIISCSSSVSLVFCLMIFACMTCVGACGRVCVWMWNHSIKLSLRLNNLIRNVNALNTCAYVVFLFARIMTIMYGDVNIYLVRRTSFYAHQNRQSVQM